LACIAQCDSITFRVQLSCTTVSSPRKLNSEQPVAQSYLTSQRYNEQLRALRTCRRTDSRCQSLRPPAGSAHGQSGHVQTRQQVGFRPVVVAGQQAVLMGLLLLPRNHLLASDTLHLRKTVRQVRLRLNLTKNESVRQVRQRLNLTENESGRQVRQRLTTPAVTTLHLETQGLSQATSPRIARHGILTV
jgi:hypothetical protein